MRVGFEGDSYGIEVCRIFLYGCREIRGIQVLLYFVQ